MCEGDGCEGCECEGCACEGCECTGTTWLYAWFCCYATDPAVLLEPEPKQKKKAGEEAGEGPTPPLVMLRTDEAKYQSV